MDLERIKELEPVYRNGLLNNTLPFWTEHAIDREFGGFTFMLNRDGTRMDTDKGVWHQGRFTWLLSTLHNRWEQREEWLELARHGIDFLNRHCFDADGRMFFLVDRQGNPLRKRRYLFTECFGAIAFAAYAKASGEQWAADKAVGLWELIMHYLHTPGLLEPKWTDHRQSKSLAIPMILLVTAQELRENLGDRGYTETIDRLIEKVQSDWMKPEFNAVMEIVGPNGEFIDHMDGRLLNPGHAIELSWFLMRESVYRDNEQEILDLALTILDWMWEWGWDTEQDGILYYRDVKGLPSQEYWHDMKFWWPQTEAIIATLMAWQLTRIPKYAEWHSLIHHYAHQRFPDPEYGEWFGYLHRDGTVANPAKGNLWKGPFHLPRMQMVCAELLLGMQ